MGSTAKHALPFPEGTSPTLPPYDMQQLAEAVDDKMLATTTGAGGRVHITDPMTGTTDASGYCSFTHDAPFTPRLVQVEIIRNAFSLGYVISCYIDGPNTVNARFGKWDATTTLNSQALGAGAIRLVCWE